MHTGMLGSQGQKLQALRN